MSSSAQMTNDDRPKTNQHAFLVFFYFVLRYKQDFFNFFFLSQLHRRAYSLYKKCSCVIFSFCLLFFCSFSRHFCHSIRCWLYMYFTIDQRAFATSAQTVGASPSHIHTYHIPLGAFNKHSIAWIWIIINKSTCYLLPLYRSYYKLHGGVSGRVDAARVCTMTYLNDTENLYGEIGFVTRSILGAINYLFIWSKGKHNFINETLKLYKRMAIATTVMFAYKKNRKFDLSAFFHVCSDTSVNWYLHKLYRLVSSFLINGTLLLFKWNIIFVSLALS